MNQILSGCNLILKLNDEDLKKIVSVHSNILNYILKNNDFNDYLKKILINRLVIEYFFPKSIIKRFKFKLSNLNEEDYRFSLSSTTICSYAIAKYANLWKENLKAKDYEDLIDLKSYYMYIVDSLGIFLKLIDNENLNNNTSYYNKNEFNSLQAVDEFSLLNIIGRLKEILKQIKEMDNKWEYRQEIVLEMISKICIQYNENKLIFQDNTHPFIYYRFIQLLFNWKDELSNYFSSENRFNQKYFDSIWNEVYLTGKYEMYRQISLYESSDKSLFDAKRLLYSLLIVSINNRYSNKKVRDQALHIIFDELLESGLWPIGSDVNTDFVLDGGVIRSKTSRIISSSPTLSSVECLSDLLEYQENLDDNDQVLIKEIERNHEYKLKLKKSYEWMITRLRYESKNLLLTEDDIKSSEGLILKVIDLISSSSATNYFSDELIKTANQWKYLYNNDPIIIKTNMEGMANPTQKTLIYDKKFADLVNILKSIKNKGQFPLKTKILLKLVDDDDDPNLDLAFRILNSNNLCLVSEATKDRSKEKACRKIYDLIKSDLINLILKDLNKLLLCDSFQSNGENFR